MTRRRTLSRADVVSALSLLLLVAGGLLPATAQFRDAAARSRSSNNLKQIVLGIHNYNDAFRGRLPPLVDIQPGGPTGKGLASIYFNLLPYLEQEKVFRAFDRSKPESYYAKDGGAAGHIISTFISPADDTAMNGTTTTLKAKGPDGSEWTGTYATCSYAANGLVPWNAGGFPRSFSDGVSNTLVVAERAQVCKPAMGDPVYNLWGFGTYGPSTPAFAVATPKKPEGLASTGMAVPVLPLPEKWSKDPIKVTFGGDGGEAKALPAGPPFQIGPFKDKPCDPRLPSTPHATGILVAMGDGSVRTVSPKVSQWTFWAACTPAGNETIMGDW